MSAVSGVVVFIITWWVVLFAVLPFGVEPDTDPAVGMAGAPRRPRLGRKALWTTLVTAILWVAIYLLVSSGLISFRDMADQP